MKTDCQSHLIPSLPVQKDFFCHAHNKDGLVGVVFADKDYPVRSAFCVINKVHPSHHMSLLHK